MLSVIHNPIVDRQRGLKLSQVMGWHDPDTLAAEYIRDVRAASYGLVDHQVVERVERDGFPVKADGFCYDVAAYLRCWQTRRGFHEPDAVDYHALLQECDVVQKVNAGHLDEVWLFGFPYAGYHESIMVGPGAFWCNSPPLALEPMNQFRGRFMRRVAPSCQRRFVIMGFNYEREVGCMLEDLGHRAESIMAQVYARSPAESTGQVSAGTIPEPTLWERFSRYDLIAPGHAAVGNMHFAPNSTHDYDWGNRRKVLSDCDDWLRYPDLRGSCRLVDCHDWGEGDMRLHHLWWFERLPHASGSSERVSHNWWSYIADPNNV